MSNDPAAGVQDLHAIFRQELAGKSKDRIFAILLVHRQADADALCSASGLSAVLRSAFPEIGFQFKIVAPQGASSLGTDVCKKLAIEFESNLDQQSFSDCDLLVVLDTGDLRLLDPYTNDIVSSSAKKILIDHHASSISEVHWENFDYVVVNAEATSVCEMIVNGFPEQFLDPETAKVLLVGLLFDSQHLGIATASTLEAALRLVKAGSEIDEAKKVLRRKPDRSEILARIKSAQRIQYEEVKGFIFLRCQVSSFHASVARMLLEIGADLGIAYGKSEGEARLSARSTQNFHKLTGIDLGTFSKGLSESLGLVGGGHATAASISGNADPDSLANDFLSSLRSALLQK